MNAIIIERRTDETPMDAAIRAAEEYGWAITGNMRIRNEHGTVRSIAAIVRETGKQAEVIVEEPEVALHP